MIVLPFIALLLGVFVAIAFRFGPLPGIGGQYLAVACLAGIDTVCGGIRSGLESKFRNDVFITGFLSNMLVAFFLAWLGDKIGVNLFLAVVLALGARIFTNLSLIRRYALTMATDALEKRRRRQSSPPAEPSV